MSSLADQAQSLRQMYTNGETRRAGRNQFVPDLALLMKKAAFKSAALELMQTVWGDISKELKIEPAATIDEIGCLTTVLLGKGPITVWGPFTFYPEIAIDFDKHYFLRCNFILSFADEPATVVETKFWEISKTCIYPDPQNKILDYPWEFALTVKERLLNIYKTSINISADMNRRIRLMSMAQQELPDSEANDNAITGLENAIKTHVLRAQWIKKLARKIGMELPSYKDTEALRTY